MTYTVYILYSASLDKFYVGFSESVEIRLKYHNNPIESRKFTACGIPWELKKQITCPDKKSAMRLERKIKEKKSGQFIEVIIAGEISVTP
ncbi:MAG TPA: GIY-YIG nuclease family protein [Chryseosolibacter sp.]